MRRLAVAPLLICALAGCGGAGEQADPSQSASEYKVRVWHDDQRRVTCWIIKEGHSGGMSCLPDSEVGP